jgi:hypothetical protein
MTEPADKAAKVKNFLELMATTPEEQAESERLHDETFAAVNEASPDIVWERFGGGCPEQGFGWFVPTGEAVYFRVRHDFARLDVGPVDPTVKPGSFFYPSVVYDGVRLTAGVQDIGGYGGTEGPDHARQTIRTLRAMLRPVGTAPIHHSRTEQFIAALKDLEELYGPGQMT